MTPRARGRKRRGGRGKGGTSRRWLGALAGLVALVALVALGGLWSWTRSGGPQHEPMPFEISPDATVGELCMALEQAGVVDQPRLFEVYLALTNRGAKVRRGNHLLRRGLSPAALAARLIRSGARAIVKFTIVEGYNRFTIADRLQALDVAGEDAFLAASVDAEQLHVLGVTGESAEGYLFPATYELYVDSDPALVLRTFVRETTRRFQIIAERYPHELAARRSRQGWGMHELLTLASVVEKEAADSREHGAIASVFFNRLNDPSFRPRQMLQSDPTAGYGCLLAGAGLPSCRDYAGNVTAAMLRDASNAYNTYKHPGLPPGPIANPSQSAVEAVVNPPETPYFFFVAGETKRHVFSRTLSEHERAIVTGKPAEARDDDEARDRGNDVHHGADEE